MRSRSRAYKGEYQFGDGVKSPRFRTPKIWSIENRVLYGVMLADNITLLELSREIKVSTRTIQRWVFEGHIPNEQNKEKVCNFFHLPESVLFNYRGSVKIDKQGSSLKLIKQGSS